MMAKFENTLRQIIYHYSQQTLPIPVALQNKQVYKLPTGLEFEFAPILPEHDITLDERLNLAKDHLLPASLVFYNARMRDDYYDIFCAENLMREIEYETTTYFLKRWHTNIKKCLSKYNTLYSIMDKDIDFLSTYDRNVDERVDDDTTHGKTIEGSGNDSLIHGLTTTTITNSENEGKTVFEDTPENELLNENYATNITKTGNESSGSNVASNSGTDEHRMQSTSRESGNTLRDMTRILHEYGRNKTIPEILEEIYEARFNILENMVNETSTGLFMKVW